MSRYATVHVLEIYGSNVDKFIVSIGKFEKIDFKITSRILEIKWWDFNFLPIVIDIFKTFENI